MPTFEDATKDMAVFIKNLPFISPVLRQHIMETEQQHIDDIKNKDLSDHQKAEDYAPHLFNLTLKM